MWAGWTVKVKPAWVRSSRRRGDAEARTSIWRLLQGASHRLGAWNRRHARCDFLTVLDGEAGMEAGGGGEAPGHAGGVVG